MGHNYNSKNVKEEHTTFKRCNKANGRNRDRKKWSRAQFHLRIIWQNGKGKSVLFWYFPWDHQQTSFTFYLYIYRYRMNMKYTFLLPPSTLYECEKFTRKIRRNMCGMFGWSCTLFTVHRILTIHALKIYYIVSVRIGFAFSGLIIYSYADKF